MKSIEINRRQMLKGSMAFAASALAQYPLSLFGGPEMDEGGVLIPFSDLQPVVKGQTRWQDLTDWHTRSEDLYVVSHYNTPTLKAEDHWLEISGLVKKPIRHHRNSRVRRQWHGPGIHGSHWECALDRHFPVSSAQ
jgi:hypothetical protein